MTPKEKAKQLVESMTFNCRECDNAKLAALIAVDEILDLKHIVTLRRNMHEMEFRLRSTRWQFNRLCGGSTLVEDD